MAIPDTGGVPAIDVADETFVAATPETVARYVSNPDRWEAWFDGLTLVVGEDRGTLGVRWLVLGALVGTAEIWIEPVGDGALIHLFLRGQTQGRASRRAHRTASSRWGLRVKTVAFGIKDALEEGRYTRPPRPQQQVTS